MSKLIRPFRVTDAALVSTTATETVAEYNGATVYVADDKVRDDTTHRIYQSVHGASATVTMTIASPCVVSLAAHGYANGTPVLFTTTGALPTGITAGTVYYIVGKTDDTFQVAATADGTPIDTTGSQSGTHTATFNPNSGHNPAADDGSHWIDIGPTNQWAQFDDLNYTQTTHTGDLVTVVQTSGRMDSVALLNVVGTEVTIYAEDSLGAEAYNQTYSLIDYTLVTDWWSYFFEELPYKSDLVVTDIPPNQDLEFTITLTGADTACGVLLFGLSKYIGEAVYGSRVGIDDFSRADRDQFGNFTGITQRPWSKRGQFSMFVESKAVDALYNLFAQYRSTPVLWVMTEGYTRGQIFGFYKSFEFVFSHPNHDEFDLVLEGVT